MFNSGIFDDGRIEYRNRSGKLHNIDGPAIIYPSGTKKWIVNGILHRTDGPAIEWSSGKRSFYINGVQVPEKEYPDLVLKTKLDKLKNIAN
jgi:hypothetical protein